VLLANGPSSIAQLGDLVILTFTQLTPRIDGTGLNQVVEAPMDAVVVCRVGLPNDMIAELVRLFKATQLGAPVAGSA
jgi:hypothetical protein